MAQDTPHIRRRAKERAEVQFVRMGEMRGNASSGLSAPSGCGSIQVAERGAVLSLSRPGSECCD